MFYRISSTKKLCFKQRRISFFRQMRGLFGTAGEEESLQFSGGQFLVRPEICENRSLNPAGKNLFPKPKTFCSSAFLQLCCLGHFSFRVVLFHIQHIILCVFIVFMIFNVINPIYKLTIVLLWN